MIFDNGKRADCICLIVPEKGNDYEIDIHTAAVTLNDSGYGDAIYLTHYNSGNSVWSIPLTEDPLDQGSKTLKATFRKNNGSIEFN